MDADELRLRIHRNGYALLPGMVSPANVVALREAISHAPERDPGTNPLSLGAMRFASNLFYGSPALASFLSSPEIVELATILVGPDVWVRWDQAVWKHPGAPAFPLHQDNGYTGLTVAHLQLWVALSTSNPDTAGLLVAAGAHTEALPHRWEGNHVVVDVAEPLTAVEANPGDVVVFTSLLPHATTPNTSDQGSLAYVAEFLPTACVDPSVPPPHLRLTENGVAVARWEDVSRLAPDDAGRDSLRP